jgi:hypothetical protein
MRLVNNFHNLDDALVIFGVHIRLCDGIDCIVSISHSSGACCSMSHFVDEIIVERIPNGLEQARATGSAAESCAVPRLIEKEVRMKIG